MRTAFLFVGSCLLSLAPSFGQMYHGSSFPGYNPANWTHNWGATVTANGLTAGTLISNIAPPTGNDYEVQTTFRLTKSLGSYATLLRASQNAIWPAQGTYYAVELAEIQINGGVCTAQVKLWKTVAGSMSILFAANTTCADGMKLRILMRNNLIYVFRDDLQAPILGYDDSSSAPITAGRPGVGVHTVTAGNGISGVSLVQLDTVPPPTIRVPGVTPLPNKVEIQWQAANDGSGSGVYAYHVVRQDAATGVFSVLAMSRRTSFVDYGVTPSSVYNYRIYTVDLHQNWSASREFTVNTPPAGSRDIRTTGLRPDGVYWGGAGEQIDMQSANVNYTLPLYKARLRSGQTVTFGLNYNSQTWRKDAGGIWHFGRDIGYGYGWRLLAGSLTPVYSGPYAVGLYIFTDSTGAEYRLDRWTADPLDSSYKIWTASEGFWGTYEERTNRLWFNDGSFWLMNIESFETEEDAGTRYPSLIQDSNGNQVEVSYQKAPLSPYTNDSGRIVQIRDSAAGTRFGYNGTRLGYMDGASGLITFTYSPSPRTIVSPWGAGDYGTAYTLTQVYRSKATYNFDFGNPSSPTTGELQSVTLPYGGRIRWEYQDFTFLGNRTTREMVRRFLRTSAAAGGPETLHWIWHNEATQGVISYHDAAVLVQDVPGVPYSHKQWWFNPDGRLHHLQEFGRNAQQQNVILRESVYTWSFADTANQVQPYISRSDHYTHINGKTLASSSEQTLDVYGNVTESRQITGSRVRTATRTYLHDTKPVYISRYIRNRVTSVTVTDGVKTYTPLSVVYDGLQGLAPTSAGKLPADLDLYDESVAGNQYRGNATMISKGVTTTNILAMDFAGVPTKWSGPEGTVISQLAVSGHGVPSQMSVNGISTTVTWDDMVRPSSVTGSLGDTATFGWDVFDRPTGRSNPDGSRVSISYSFTDATTLEWSGGRWKKMQLDGLGRPIRTTTGYGGRPLPEPNPGMPVYPRTPMVEESVTETEYAPCACGPFGRVIRETVPRAAGTTTKLWNVTTYDALGRVFSVKTAATGTDGSGHKGETIYDYDVETVDGEVMATVKVTPSVNAGQPARWKKTGTDGFGDMRRVWEPRPGGGADYVSIHTYNAIGKLETVSMTRNGARQEGVVQTRSFAYYSDGTLKETVFPETGKTTYEYGNGKLALKRDALGRETRYIYDGARLRGTEYLVPMTMSNPTGIDKIRSRYYNYDSAGRMVSVTDGNGNEYEKMGYTNAGQLAWKMLYHEWERRTELDGTPRADWVPLKVSYTYDGEGRVDTMTYPSGKKVKMKYDVTERNTELVEPDPPFGATPKVYAQAGYGWRGEMRWMALIDNVHPEEGWGQSWTYDELGRMSGYGHRKSGSYDMTTSVTYNYGPVATAGKASSITTTYSTPKWGQANPTVTGYTVDYAYDSLGRLTTATAPEWSQSFSHDGFGNLYKIGGTGRAVSGGGTVDHTATVNSAKNQLSEYHDAVGNPTSTNPQLKYNYDNRFETDGHLTNTYGLGNKRITRQHDTMLREVTLWVGNARIGIYRFSWDEYTANWVRTIVQEDLYIGGRKIAPQDRLGSDVTNKKVYLPYGWELDSLPGDPDGDKFATYRREGGADYADQRTYSPWIGRFSTADPYVASGGPGNPGSWNRYAYVNGDPVNKIDPRGLDEEGAPAINCVIDGVWYVDPRICDFEGLLKPGKPSPSVFQFKNIVINEYNDNSSLISRTFDDFSNRLESDSTCMSWLNDAYQKTALAKDPTINTFAKYLGALKWAVGTADISGAAGINAVASPNVAGAVILFQRNGDFFTDTGTPIAADRMKSFTSTIQGGSDAMRRFILAHELAHLVSASGFLDHDLAEDRQKRNNDLTYEKCSKTIR